MRKIFKKIIRDEWILKEEDETKVFIELFPTGSLYRIINL